MADPSGGVRDSHGYRDRKATRRNLRVAGIAAAAGGFVALGITPATAHADLEDLILHPMIAALDPTVAETATIPLTVYKGSEPLVDVSVGGDPSVPVLVDTGSNGLTLPASDVPWQSFFGPWDGYGIANYGGDYDGLDYFFVQLPETLDFTTTTGQVVSDKTDVDVELFAWPSSLWSSFWSYQAAEGPNGAAGVLGIGPDALGPDVGVPPPTAGLPGDLGKGVLIDESAGYLRFGPAPTDLGAGVSTDGVDNTTLDVQVNGGDIVPVSNSFIDSGGLIGTIPSNVVPNATIGLPLPAGTTISVYNTAAQLLYTYTTAPAPDLGSLGALSNGPTVINAGDLFNTGYEAFQQGPVYIDYAGGPNGGATTTFYPGS